MKSFGVFADKQGIGILTEGVQMQLLRRVSPRLALLDSIKNSGIDHTSQEKLIRFFTQHWLLIDLILIFLWFRSFIKAIQRLYKLGISPSRSQYGQSTETL